MPTSRYTAYGLAFLTFIALSSAFAAELRVDPALGKVVHECAVKNPKKHLWIFKQWHLAPSINTHKNPTEKYPQAENQLAIYDQLARWITDGKLATVLAEGCTGEISTGFPLSFNGWDLALLQGQASSPEYAKILAPVPMKLEAKFGEKLATLCADNTTLVRKQGLALSDARGVIGFYSRIEQFKNDSAGRKPYMEGAIDLFHLPKKASPSEVLARLKVELKKSIAEFESLLEQRNEKMAQVAEHVSASDQALVVGGMHAEGLAKALEKAGIACTVVEPSGYGNDDEKLALELHKLLQM